MSSPRPASLPESRPQPLPTASPTPHPVDESRPIGRILLFGIQHVLVMAATPISAIFLMSATLRLDPGLTVDLLSAAFLLSGAGTLVQSLGPWKFGPRLPFVILPGGAPLSWGAGWTWLEHAGRGGADAVGLGAPYRPTAEGAAAELLLVDVIGPEMRLSWDLPWELVRRGNRDQITAVFVAGRLRLWRGQPTDWDGPALVRRAAELSRKVVERAPVTRVHPTSTRARRARAERSAAQ